MIYISRKKQSTSHFSKGKRVIVQNQKKDYAVLSHFNAIVIP